MKGRGKRVIVLIDQVPPNAPPDREDAVIQAGSVSGALSLLGYAPGILQVSLDLRGLTAALHREAPAFVFNLVESLGGLGRLIHLIPALLDGLEIPYTGADTQAMYLTSHKLVAKRVMRAAGIPTPFCLGAAGSPSLKALNGGGFIVKSVWEHASLGLDDGSVVFGAVGEEMLLAVERRREMTGGSCFAEQYVDGREFNLSLLGRRRFPEVLPPAEIRFEGFPPGKPKIVGYRAKWDQASSEYRCTRRSFEFPPEDAPLLERLKSIAVDCWRVFGLCGYARVDFRVDEDGHPWVLEVNANPCLAPDAGFVAAAERAGMLPVDIVRRIVEDIEPHRASTRQRVRLEWAAGV